MRIFILWLSLIGTALALPDTPILKREADQYAIGPWRWMRAGLNSPENLLSYSGFVRTPGAAHNFEPHGDDWRPGDPDGGPGDGTGPLRNIIGMVNYVSQYVNSFYLVIYTIDGGDDKRIHPWADSQVKGALDDEKMDQWYTFFEYANKCGIEVHILFSEDENQFNVRGNYGYFQAVVQRFGTLPMVTWNIGEENDYSNQQVRDHVAVIRAADPGGHPVLVHTDLNDPVPGALSDLDGVSLQCNINRFDDWAENNALADYPKFADEQFEGYEGAEDLQVLGTGWRRFLERGGAGFGFYLGSTGMNNAQPFAHDLYCNDFRMIEPLLILVRSVHDEFNLVIPTLNEIERAVYDQTPRHWWLDINGDGYLDLQDIIDAGGLNSVRDWSIYE